MAKNGWVETTVPDLKVGDIILFNNEEPTDQGHQVTSIFTNGDDDIFVCYIPEWTPTSSFSIFTYGAKEFHHKK